MSKPSDEQILSVLSHLNSAATYLVRNWLAMDRGFKGLKTDWLRRQLYRLEREGKVERVRGLYAVQITWAVVKSGNAS